MVSGKRVLLAVIKCGNQEKEFEIHSTKINIIKKKKTRNHLVATLVPEISNNEDDKENMDENLICSFSISTTSSRKVMKPFTLQAEINDLSINDKPMKMGQKQILLDNDIVSVSSDPNLFFKFTYSESVDVSDLPMSIVDNYFVEKDILSENDATKGKIYFIHEIRSREKVVLKRITKTERDDPLEIALEAKIMTKLNHPHIVRLIKVVDLLKETFILIEYMNCCDLLRLIMSKRRKRLTEKEAQLYFNQIVSGLSYLHDQNICHRDIKCENVFVNFEGGKAIAKLGDFGLSAYDENLTRSCGTLFYVAPEIIVKDSNEPYLGKKVDIWSLGVTVYAMLSGKYPFYSDSRVKAKELISKGEFTYPDKDWITISPEAKELISGMLCKDVENRYDIHQVQKLKWNTNIEYIDKMPLNCKRQNTTSNSDNIKIKKCL